MRPGARAAFTEPLGTNPVLGWARDHVPYPGKNPVGGDEPLTEEALVAWQGPFACASKREIQLLSMAGRALGRRPPAWLVRADDALLARFPRLRRYCRYVVLTLRKAEAVEPRFSRTARSPRATSGDGQPAGTGWSRPSATENLGPSA
jgi:hypothetical protein